MSYEQPRSFENPVTQEEIIELWERDSRTAMEVLKTWIEQTETQANEINTPEANTACVIELGKLYMKIGVPEAAWDALEDARISAIHQGNTELLAEIEELQSSFLI